MTTYGSSNRTGHTEHRTNRNDGMSILNEAGTKFFAAISALAVSAVFMATAIAPATQNIAMIA
jgi:hypothetical protein